MYCDMQLSKYFMLGLKSFVVIDKKSCFQLNNSFKNWNRQGTENGSSSQFLPVESAVFTVEPLVFTRLISYSIPS